MLRDRAGEFALATPAKVNLFLEVLARRPDRYHDLATLMVAVTLFDELDFSHDASGEVTLTCDRADLSCGPENLVQRAALALRLATGCRAGATIHLTKRIPMAAGLAGGSSDAAAALRGLNRLWDLKLPDADLMKIGAGIGSDVAFFFATPAAWCTGRGEVVTPLPLGRELHLVLLCPGFGLSTAQVFGRLRVPDQPDDASRLRAAFVAGDLEQLGRLLHNRLQEPAEELRPELASLRLALAQTSPLGCLMSGSGSALFALCRDREDAIRVARQLGAAVPDDLPRDTGSDAVMALGPAGTGWTLYVVRSCV